MAWFKITQVKSILCASVELKLNPLHNCVAETNKKSTFRYKYCMFLSIIYKNQHIQKGSYSDDVSFVFQ